MWPVGKLLLSSQTTNPTASWFRLWTAVPLRLRLRQTNKLFRWITEHTCRDADAEMHMQTVMGLLTCFSLRAKSPALPPFLSNPLPSFSSSISPVTKGVFLFKGPQKPLGTQSENCYNWWRRGEAGRDRGLYCCRVQKDMARKLLSEIVIACLLLHCDITFVKGFNFVL